MTRTLDLTADPTKTEEVAALLHEHTAGDDAAYVRHTWSWASRVAHSQQQAETAYFAVLTAGGVTPPADPEPAAPAPKPAPDPEQEPDAPDTDNDPERTARAPVATPDHEPLPGDLLRRLAALTRRVEAEPTTTAGQVPKWDPEETPTIAGQVALTEWADLRGQRAGAVRLLTLRTERGPVSVWCSWQQLAALLLAHELAHGRALAPGDLLALHAAGKQCIGKSRSPSRLFTVLIEWTP